MACSQMMRLCSCTPDRRLGVLQRLQLRAVLALGIQAGCHGRLALSSALSHT